jgi:hypothetical protein
MLLELTALWGFAFVQPVLDVFGRSPEQFVFRQADATVVVRFGLVLTVVPIAVLWAVEQVGGLVHRIVGQALHVAFVAGLLGVIGLRVLKQGIGLSGPVLAVGAAALAVAGTVVFVRFVVVRQWARFAAVGTVAFLLLFLFASPTADLVRGGAVTASGARVAHPSRVVMVVFDELPLASLIDADGRIDAELYPNFADLAGRSSWFRNTTAVSPTTWHAVPAIDTGRYPTKGGPVARDHPQSIFTLLGGSYRMDVTESVTRLCPTSVCRGSDLDRSRSLRRLGDDARGVVRSQLALHETHADPVAGAVEGSGNGIEDLRRNQPERFTRFLTGIRADEPRTFHYLHILLPHVPWRYLPSGAQYAFPDNDPGKVDDAWIDQAWPPQLARERHLLQLRYTDRLLGELLTRLRDTGTFDDTLLVVTADHGIAFQPGQPVRGLEVGRYVDAIHPDVMWVPLLVKRPHQQDGAIVDANVETVDVLPTIADVLGVEVPWKLDGRSAFSDRPRGDTKVFFQSKVNGFGVDVGPRAEVDAADGWRVLRDRTVDRFLGTRLSDGDGRDDLRSWSVGPRPDLIDRPLDDLATGEASGATAQLDRAGDLASVDRGTAPLPAMLTGTIDGGPSGPLTIVWGLNGRIAAVTPTYVDGDRAHAVAVLLPEPMVRDGANRLDLFLLGPGDRLDPVPVR